MDWVSFACGAALGVLAGVGVSMLRENLALEVERAFWRKELSQMANRLQSWSPEQYSRAQANDTILASVPEQAEPPRRPESLEEAVANHPDFQGIETDWSEDGQSLTIIDPHTLRGEVIDRQRVRHIVGWFQD